MAFDAGAVIGHVLLDTKDWVKGVNTVQSTGLSAKNLFKNIAAGAAVLGAGVAAAFTDSVKKADDWQKSFANVTTLVDTSAVNVQGMAKELLALDGALGSSKDLTDGLYQALSASVEPTKAVGFVADSARFAKAALVDTNTAVDVITTGLNAYGLQAEEAGRVSDVLFTTIKRGKTTGAELSSTIGQIIPIAANMNLSFENLGASIATMTRQGVKSAHATTQLQAIMTALLKPSEEMSAAMKAAGFETGQAVTSSENFQEALQKIIAETDGSKESIASLFPSIEALRGTLSLTGEGAKGFTDDLAAMTTSAGATNEAFGKQELTFETLKNKMGTISIIAGNVGKVFVDQLAGGASKAASSMIDFVLSGRAAEPISTVMGTISGSFSLLKTTLAPIVETLFPALKEIGISTGTTIAQLTGKTDAASGSFSLISGIIASVSSVIKVFSSMITGAIQNIGNLIEAIRSSGGVIGDFFDFLTGKKKWDDVKAGAKSAGEAFAKLGKGLVDNVVDPFRIVFEETATFNERSKGLAKGMELSYTSAFSKTKNSFKSGFDEMVTGQEAFVDSILVGNETIVESSSNTTELLYKDTVKQKNAQEELQAAYEKTAEKISSTFNNVLSSLGETLADSEKGWESFKQVAKNAIATIAESYGKLWALESAAAFASANIPLGIGLAAASAGAYIGAGVIRGLATGGVARGMTLVGEKGPELINVGTPSRVYPANETARMTGGKVDVNIVNYVRNDSDIDRLNREFGRTLENVVRKIS